MTIGIHTNTSALVALQNLNSTATQLQKTQQEISTGLKVSSAKDDASIYAIAQKQRADISALQAVTNSLNRATSVADVASTAGQSVSDLLNQMKQKVVSAMDPSLSTDSRTALNDDYKSLLRQIQQAVQSATFDGANILDASQTNPLNFIANADANLFITLTPQDLTLGGPNISMAATSSINTVTNATTVLSQLNTSISNVNLALANVGAQSNQIDSHKTFVGKLSDALTQGVSNLVDADMAAESAKLQSLQVQQQLGAQSLSIANQAPQIVLSLFK